jgi:hypothetical protein
LIGRAELRRERELCDLDKAEYKAALQKLKEATAEIRSTSTTSLDALRRRVQDNDELMREALRRKRGSRPDHD